MRGLLFEYRRIYIFFAQVRSNRTTLKIPINLSMMFNYRTQFPQNSQSTLIMNILYKLSYREDEYNMFMCPNRHGCSFSCWSGTFFCCVASDLFIEPNILTERDSDDELLPSFDNFCCTPSGAWGVARIFSGVHFFPGKRKLTTFLVVAL